MKILKFIKGPGYLYDLFIMFIFYFNQELFLSEQINPNKSAEDTEHFTRILNEIKTIPEDLRVFFQLRENKKSYFTTRYFLGKIREVLAGYNLESIQNSLTDHKKVIGDVAAYYFGAQYGELDCDDPQFFRQVGKLICDSEYDPILKNSLYKFFWNPVSTLQVLSNELTKKEALLSKIYAGKEEVISKVQNKIDLGRLENKVFSIKSNSFDLSSFDEIIVSNCALHKNVMFVHISEGTAFLLLGIDYENFSEYLNTRKRKPELVQLGIALSEENRLQILEFISEKGEASVHELRQFLGLSHTNTYYHVSLLLKANLLKFRNRGRTMYYSIDGDYFNDVRAMLSKFQKKGSDKI